MAERLNLDVLVSSTLHSHLYLKVDGTEASNSNYVSDIERRNNIYTSPRNIRKIFIKETGIDVVYYRPIAGNSKRLSETINYSTKNRSLVQIAYEDFIREYKVQNSVKRVNIAGTGFTALAKDFSLSNLEELYFDWTLLLGNQNILNKFMQINSKLEDYSIQGLSVKEKEFYTEPNSTKVQKVSVLQASQAKDTNASNFLMEYISNIVEDISTCFPRLKYIGFIGNSSEVLHSEGELTSQKLLSYEYHTLYNQYKADELKQRLCKGDKFRFCIFADTGINLFTAPFRVDSALYKFDADYLYDYLKASMCKKGVTKEAELTDWFIGKGSTRLGLESKLAWIEQFRAGQLVGQKEAKKSLEKLKVDNENTNSVILDNKPRNDLEYTLSRINSEEDLIFTLKCLVMEYKREDLLKLFSEFSPAGSEYYSKKLRELEE